MDNKDKGLYGKFEGIFRSDGGSGLGRKHENCRYFILDIDHDKYAKAALFAYALECRADYLNLSSDLLRWHDRGEWPLE